MSARQGLIASIAVALVATTALSSPAEAGKVRPRLFGVHGSQVVNGTATRVPVSALRLWDSGTTWRQIETSKGDFNWSLLDQTVQTARAAGVRPLLVLGQTPRFHAERRNAPGVYGEGATSMPEIRPWKRYVGKVARRYKDSIDYQVWNEPNVIQFWTGTHQQMAKLTEVASKKITQVVGRRATVVGPSFPLRLKGQQRWFRDYYQARVGGRNVASFVDVVAANLYPLSHQGPEASIRLLDVAKESLPVSARRKPLWNTEINYGLINGIDPAKRISDAKQAAFVARTLVLNAASSVRRMYWYSWGIGRIANTHLVKGDGTTLTRAGRAWKVSRGWIVGTRARQCHQADSGVYTCTFRAGRREVRRIYWKPTGASVRIQTHRTTRKWTNLSGDTHKHRGSLRLEVGKQPKMVTSRR